MPLYTIHHCCHLTPQQHDDLAWSITEIHSTKFSTPRMFVNVSFSPITSSTPPTYVGGKPRRGNHIIANVRAGPSRTETDWNDLTSQIVAAWNRIVPMPQAKGSVQQDYSLRSCILLGGMIGGYEAGFMLPKAGGDVQWMRDHWEEFQMKAKSGDEEFVDLVNEVKERGLLEANGKSAKEKLEEALGWGDSA